MRQHSGAFAPKRNKRMTGCTFSPGAAKSSSGPRDYTTTGEPASSGVARIGQLLGHRYRAGLHRSPYRPAKREKVQAFVGGGGGEVWGHAPPGKF